MAHFGHGSRQVPCQFPFLVPFSNFHSFFRFPISNFQFPCIQSPCGAGHMYNQRDSTQGPQCSAVYMYVGCMFSSRNAPFSYVTCTVCSRDMDGSPLLRDELIAYYSLRDVPVSDMKCILQTDSWLYRKVRVSGESHRRMICYSVSCPLYSKRQLIRLRKKIGVSRNRSESSMSDIFDAIQIAIYSIIASVGN